MLKKLLTVSLFTSTMLSFHVQAEDRALLIGVGEYQNNPKDNLPGIDLDINMMKEAATLMGYDDIKVVLNEQATLNNVIQIMKDYLIKGVNAGDRVLIYFSGHGARIPDLNGDEKEDGADEVLTMYDLRQVTIQGRPSLAGVLIDDELNKILKAIPSRNILVLLDACNSGTATKNISLIRGTLGDGLKAVSKSLNYKGMPLAVSKGNFMVVKNKQKESFVAISAAGDTENAQATPKGSLFTLGVFKAVKDAAKNSTGLTPNTLKNKTTQYIQQENKEKPFTPRMSGNTTLANKLIKLRSTTDGYGENWKKLVGYADKAEPLNISINQPDYALGEKLVITINNNQSGYLNVININSKDDSTILFPNQHNPDAKVSGSITIPTTEMKFYLESEKPLGNSLVVAFLTDKPLNLYRTGDASKGNKGEVDHLFHSISALGLDNISRSFSPVKKAEKTSGNKVRAGKVITRVCASKCQ